MLSSVIYFIRTEPESIHIKKRKLVDVALRNEEKTLRSDINFRIEITKRELINADLLQRIGVLEEKYLSNIEFGASGKTADEHMSLLKISQERSLVTNAEKTAKKSSSFDDLFSLSTSHM
jgi:hypothetical protein